MGEARGEPTLLELLITLLLIGLAGYVASTTVTGFNFVNNLLSATLSNYKPGNLLPDPYPFFVMVGSTVVTVLILVIAFKIAYALRRGE
jgi:ABC-type spermidine/putrescine transport system permease subunit I